MTEVTWRDADKGRTVHLREGLLGEAPKVLADAGWGSFELITTRRASELEGADRLAGAADRTHFADTGPVTEVSAEILGEVGADRQVALGGGRVIDSAKAIAAVRGGEVAAIPTTLSGAEMTAIHRLPAGAEGEPGVRPAIVLADPGLMTSLPEPQLRATAMNSLAHGADSLYTPLADGLSRRAALRGAERIARQLDAGDGRDRSELALGSLLSADALDSAGLALHHVLSQSTVRVCGTPHAETNAALLPVVMEEMARRAPEPIAELAAALGTGPDSIRQRIEELAGGRRGLGELGADRECAPAVVERAMARPDLFRMTPGEIDPGDLARLLDAAW